MSHQPVLLHEVIRFLDLKPGEFIIDGTIDGGGHGAEIFKRILPAGKLLGVDWDINLLEKARLKIPAKIKDQKLNIKNNLILVHGNYSDLPQILENKKLTKADGLLLDLGFSSEQLENSGRGFSFTKNEPLLMTYDSNRKPAREILRELNAKELAKIIFEYSGEKIAMRIAKAIKEREAVKPIKTSGELRDIIMDVVPKDYEHGRINPATRTFQALRIYTNDELGNLKRILDNLEKVLRPDGRAVIISFHSLEDRIVKNCFREKEKIGLLKILTKKPVLPSAAEIAQNSRSRSAKLRAAEIITTD